MSVSGVVGGARASRRESRRTGAALSYLQIYRAAPLERIERARAGLPAADARRIVSDLGMPMAAAAQALAVPLSTLNRRARNREVLGRHASERFLGLARLIGQVQAMVEDAGEPAGFDAQTWMARWLNAPLAAFGGARPMDFMDTMEGQALVSDALARIRSGAYA